MRHFRTCAVCWWWRSPIGCSGWTGRSSAVARCSRPCSLENRGRTLCHSDQRQLKTLKWDKSWIFVSNDPKSTSLGHVTSFQASKLEFCGSLLLYYYEKIFWRCLHFIYVIILIYLTEFIILTIKTRSYLWPRLSTGRNNTKISPSERRSRRRSRRRGSK